MMAAGSAARVRGRWRDGEAGVKWRSSALQRHDEAGLRPASVAVGERGLAVVQRRDFGDETQAQPTAAAAALRSRQRVEALEHARQRVLGHAGAFVDDNEAD